MNPNEMMSVEEALDFVLSHVAPLEVETVSLLDAVGRVVAEDLISDCDITPFDHAAMDGDACMRGRIGINYEMRKRTRLQSCS